MTTIIDEFGNGIGPDGDSINMAHALYMTITDEHGNQYEVDLDDAVQLFNFIYTFSKLLQQIKTDEQVRANTEKNSYTLLLGLLQSATDIQSALLVTNRENKHV